MCSAPPFTFQRLAMPILGEIEARAVMGAIASLAGQPRIVLEARSSKGVITWYLGADAQVARRAVAAMRHHIQGLRTSPADTPARSDVCGVIRIRGHQRGHLQSQVG